MARESGRPGGGAVLCFSSGRARGSRTKVTVRRQPRSAILLAPLAAVAVLCAAAPVRAQHYARFQEARDAYLRGEYAHVVDVLEPLIGGEVPEIRDDVLLRESRKYLGAAYVLTGQGELGGQQFEALLRAEGDAFDQYQLDAAAFPSQVHTAFDEVRQRLIRQRREDETDLQRRREADEARRHAALLELVELAQEDEVVIEHDPLIAWVPFGAGQFQNGNADLGWFFAVSESVTFLLAAGAFAAYLPLEGVGESGGVEVDPPPGVVAATNAMAVTSWASSGAFVILAIAGIIEALANYVPSHTVRRRRQVPERILLDLDLAIGPGSLSLRVRF